MRHGSQVSFLSPHLRAAIMQAFLHAAHLISERPLYQFQRRYFFRSNIFAFFPSSNFGKRFFPIHRSSTWSDSLGRLCWPPRDCIQSWIVTLDRTPGLPLGQAKPVLFCALEVGTQRLNRSFGYGLAQLFHRRKGLARGLEYSHKGAIRQREKGKVYRGEERQGVVEGDGLDVNQFSRVHIRTQGKSLSQTLRNILDSRSICPKN